MPTVNILGAQVERKHLLIGGGLLAAAVAVVVFLRARAASAASADAAQPQAQQDQGAGMQVAAPSQAAADQYQQQMDNSALEASGIANQYQRNLVTQQQKQFDFQQSQAEALAPEMLAEQRASLAVQTHYDTAASKAAVSCPGNASVRTDPSTGQLYCRQKTSGGFLGIPLGDISRTVQGLIGGVEAAAPEIGYNTAKQAATYYTGKYFPPSGPTSKPPSKSETSKSPIKLNPPSALPSHGYEEIPL